MYNIKLRQPLLPVSEKYGRLYLSGMVGGERQGWKSYGRCLGVVAWLFGFAIRGKYRDPITQKVKVYYINRKSFINNPADKTWCIANKPLQKILRQIRPPRPKQTPKQTAPSAPPKEPILSPVETVDPSLFMQLPLDLKRKICEHLDNKTFLALSRTCHNEEVFGLFPHRLQQAELEEKAFFCLKSSIREGPWSGHYGFLDSELSESALAKALRDYTKEIIHEVDKVLNSENLVCGPHRQTVLVRILGVCGATHSSVVEPLLLRLITMAQAIEDGDKQKIALLECAEAMVSFNQKAALELANSITINKFLQVNYVNKFKKLEVSLEGELEGEASKLRHLLRASGNLGKKGIPFIESIVHLSQALPVNLREEVLEEAAFRYADLGKLGEALAIGKSISRPQVNIFRAILENCSEKNPVEEEVIDEIVLLAQELRNRNNGDVLFLYPALLKATSSRSKEKAMNIFLQLRPEEINESLREFIIQMSRISLQKMEELIANYDASPYLLALLFLEIAQSLEEENPPISYAFLLKACALFDNIKWYNVDSLTPDLLKIMKSFSRVSPDDAKEFFEKHLVLKSLSLARMYNFLTDDDRPLKKGNISLFIEGLFNLYPQEIEKVIASPNTFSQNNRNLMGWCYILLSQALPSD